MSSGRTRSTQRSIMTNAVSIDSQIVSRTGKGTRNDDVIEFDG
jgi:hypothetical protein